jgi:redox-regulated HSP33 family molecular chaperone
MSERAVFTSECPNCNQERMLTGLSDDELRELLESGAEIEAYCSSCDADWAISTEERADLARALA